MRHLPFVLVIVLGWGRILAAIDAPTTRPAGTVLVLPFVPPAGQNYDWIGKGIQQNLIAELSPNLKTTAISPGDLPATDDPATALKTARDHHAVVVIFGATQLLDKQIRITGQVLDVASGKLLGTLKSTGSLDNLFRLEDAMAGQGLQALPRTMLNLRGLAAAERGARPQIIELPGDQPAPPPIYGNSSAYSPMFAPQPYATLEPPAPPLSPYALSYPYRFYYPYYHLFSYGDGFRDGFFPFAFGFESHWHSTPHHTSHR